MACANITSDQNNYSAPVPVIGLYIGGGTMVCSLFIICDAIYGIRRRKLWFPCRFFYLNSVTLTLLSIAAKIAVDLTTPMPSALDQLSKLTGTTLICVSMAFLFPSIGASKTSESLANVASLSIVVITVIVNICIQMSTRLIFSFIVEHVIIMFVMLSLLCHSWVVTLALKDQKERERDKIEDFFVHGSGSMLNQLKKLYVGGYYSNPQFVLGRDTFSSLTSFISLLCPTLVLQAMLRSGIPNEFRWFNGTSDYGWSMNVIVGTQILLILLGSSTTCFRQFILWPVRYKPIDCDDRLGGIHYFWREICDPFLRSVKRHQCLLVAVKSVVYSLYFIMISVLHIISSFLCGVLWSCFHILICRSRETELLEEHVEDMKRLEGSIESYPIRSLTQILSKPPLSEQSLEQMHNRLSRGNEVSCLDIVMVVSIASVSIPSRLSGSLTPILREIFDVIHFVDSKMHSSKFENRQKCKLAKDLWMGEDMSKVLRKILMGSSNEPCQPQYDLDRARRIMQELKSVIRHRGKWYEIVAFDRIISLIEGHRECTSIEELYDYMEQIFVYMLHVLLPQLPEAIVKEVSESSIEELEEKVRYMLKLLWKIKSLEDKFQWSFPAGSNVTGLITEAPVTSQQHMTTMDNAASDTHVDEIIEAV